MNNKAANPTAIRMGRTKTTNKKMRKVGGILQA
jgi:hypothetical protein